MISTKFRYLNRCGLALLQVALVSQEPVLFADTIFANIAFGCEEVPTQEQVRPGRSLVPGAAKSNLPCVASEQLQPAGLLVVFSSCSSGLSWHVCGGPLFQALTVAEADVILST